MIAILYFETESLLEPRAQQLARLAGQHSEEEPDSAFLSVLRCTSGYRFTPPCQDFRMTAGDLNSGLHTYVSGTLFIFTRLPSPTRWVLEW